MARLGLADAHAGRWRARLASLSLLLLAGCSGSSDDPIGGLAINRMDAGLLFGALEASAGNDAAAEEHLVAAQRGGLSGAHLEVQMSARSGCATTIPWPTTASGSPWCGCAT